MSFYSDMADVMGDLLNEFGQTMTLTRVTGASLSPTSTGTTTAGTSTTYSPKGLVKPIPSSLVDGTRIRTGDRHVVLDNTVEPNMGDEITIDSEQWNIVEIKTYKPTNTAIGYIVTVRK